MHSPDRSTTKSELRFAASVRLCDLLSYAVEASPMANTAQRLAAANPSFGKRVVVLHRAVETVNLDHLDGEKVDVLVSEPFGTLLFNERMIESYLFARDNFLKPGGTDTARKGVALRKWEMKKTTCVLRRCDVQV